MVKRLDKRQRALLRAAKQRKQSVVSRNLTALDSMAEEARLSPKRLKNQDPYSPDVRQLTATGRGRVAYNAVDTTNGKVVKTKRGAKVVPSVKVTMPNLDGEARKAAAFAKQLAWEGLTYAEKRIVKKGVNPVTVKDDRVFNNSETMERAKRSSSL